MKIRIARARPRVSLTCAAVAVSVATPAWSQSAAANAPGAQLDPVVVIGSRSAQSLSQIPASIYVIDADDIQARARAGVPLKELLGQLIPSLDIGPQGRTNYGQNLRGRAAQVMIDGVSLTGSRAISRQFDAIDPFNIERIEVLSGASSIYGGGATGGIVNIVTRRGREGLGGTLQAGVRSDGHGGDRQLAAAVHGGNERVTGRLALAWQKNGGAYDADGKQILPDITQTDLQYNESKDLTGSLDIDLGAAGQLRLLGQHYTSAMSGDKAAYLGPSLVGALGTQPELLEVRSGFSSDVVPSTRRGLLTADWNAPKLVFGQDLLLQVYTRQEKLDFYPFPGSASVTVGGARRSAAYYGTSRQNTDASGLKSALVAHSGPVTLTYGFDYTDERFDATQTLFDAATAYASGGLDFRTIGSVGRYPGFETRQAAGYAQLDWKLRSDLRLSGGLRYQRTAVEVQDFVGFAQQVLVASGTASSADAIPGGSNHYQAALPNAGAVWSLAPRQQLYANYSEGFDLPDPAKYYGLGTYTLAATGGRLTLGNSSNVANSPLSAIKTRQLETGLRGADGALDYSVAAFYALSDKAISTVPLTLALEVVDQKVRTYGLEGSIAYRLAPQWQIGAGGIVLRTEQEVAGDWQKATVTTSSPPKLTTFVSYGNAQQLAARLQSTTVLDLSDAGGNRLRGYSTLDLSGSARQGSWLFSAGVQNLLNKQYQSIWSQRAQLLYAGLATPQTFYFPGRGRSLTLTATAEF